MELISQYINIVKKDVSWEEFSRGVTQYIFQAYKSNNQDIEFLKANPFERLTASAAIYSDFRKEVWLIGDCQTIVNNEFYDNPKPQEAPLALKRSQVIKDLLSKGYDKNKIFENDPGRAAIIDGIIDGCRYQNIRFSVIDGFPIALDKVKVINLKEDSKEVVLATDGYPFLKPTLKETEDILKEILKEDPLLIDKYKATKALMKGNKSFDDRTYIRFQV